MARPPSNVEGAIERATVAIKAAQTADEIRAAQAVLLPLLGLSLEQTATALGRRREWVSRTRSRVLRGDPMPAPAQQRGGRRHQLFTIEQEVALVKRAVLKSQGFGRSTRGELRKLVAAKRNGIVSESTLTGMIARVAPILVRGGNTWKLERCSGLLTQLWVAQQKLDAYIDMN